MNKGRGENPLANWAKRPSRPAHWPIRPPLTPLTPSGDETLAPLPTRSPPLLPDPDRIGGTNPVAPYAQRRHPPPPGRRLDRAGRLNRKPRTSDPPSPAHVDDPAVAA